MRLNANVVYKGIRNMEAFCIDIGGLITGQTIGGPGNCHVGLSLRWRRM